MYKGPTRDYTKLVYLINNLADYMIENHSTTRQLAKKFKIPKSTVHTYLSKYLKKINKSKWEKIQTIFKENLVRGRRLGGINKHLKYDTK